jgi:hypothetical protein
LFIVYYFPKLIPAKNSFITIGSHFVKIKINGPISKVKDNIAKGLLKCKAECQQDLKEFTSFNNRKLCMRPDKVSFGIGLKLVLGSLTDSSLISYKNVYKYFIL